VDGICHSIPDVRELGRDECVAMLEMFCEGTPSSILLVDRQMKVVLANRNFVSKSRKEASSVVGRPLGEVFPAAILQSMAVEERIRRVFLENKPSRGKRMTYRAPFVPLRYYYYRLLPLSSGEEVKMVMLLMEDMTEQVRLSEEVRRVEQHLARVVESANDLVISTDSSGRIRSWSSAAERLSGYSRYEVEGMPLKELFAPGHREEVERTLRKLGHGGKSEMAEWNLATREGGAVPVSWVLSPLCFEDDRLCGTVVVGRDLTERRKFEARLEQSQKLSALGVMAGGIAHEIRNPLAVVSSAAQFLMEDDLDDDFRKECAEKIHHCTGRISDIIENLLKFARPPCSDHMDRVDLRTVLQNTLKLVENQATIRKVRKEASLPDFPLLIQGFGGLLQQAFLNLFLNAIGAMPGGGTLKVSARGLPGEVVVSVEDTGKGIDPDRMERIFDPFYTTAPVGEGTGLGLSICYSIVKQHFGSIEVRSRPGEGSRFTVRLPGF